MTKSSRVFSMRADTSVHNVLKRKLIIALEAFLFVYRLQ